MSESQLRPVRRLRGRGLRKLLWKRLRIPRSIVHPALSAAKTVASPRQMPLRRKLAAEVAAAGPAFVVPDAKGIRTVAPGEIPGADAVVARCAEICSAMRASVTADDYLFNPRKRFLLALLAGADFCEHPELIRFMVSRPVLDAASAYLGSVPLLAGAALWWTRENDTAERSQLYHFDGEDERQLKLVLNVFETREENGPFTVLPADASEPICRSSSKRGRITDERVEAECGRGYAQQLVGPPGSGAFVDTSGPRRTSFHSGVTIASCSFSGPCWPM